jgi:cell fate regulator YaaT (PSP1 superfamily)
MSNPLPVFQPLAPDGADHVVEVAFKGNHRGFYLTSDEAIREGEYVVVEAERGHDLGRIRSRGGVARAKCSSTDSQASARVVRVAEPEEVRQAIVLRADEDRVRREAREMAEKHNLRMKVTDAEWQWDKNKLTIYFTAERRVDFRELVRDLARTFRTRIELKQIGVRDEAAMLGGLGRCGRQLCCATWLREIRPVSLQLAKDQSLSLNPSQISGTCGRLMCCLTYEHDAYVAARKRFPREGKMVQTSHGQERVIGVDIWRETVTLLDESKQRRTITLGELKQETGSRGAGRAEAPRREADVPGNDPSADASAAERAPVRARDEREPEREARPGAPRSSTKPPAPEQSARSDSVDGGGDETPQVGPAGARTGRKSSRKRRRRGSGGRSE